MTDRRSVKEHPENWARRHIRGLPRLEPPAFIAACVIIGLGVFFLLEPVPGVKAGTLHEVAVFAGFMLAPLALLLLTGRQLGLGGLDRFLPMGIGLYMLFFLPLAALVPFNRGFFEGYRMAPVTAVAWALLTLIQVSSVDFFTKRIVQLEAERRWGPSIAMGAQFAAWCIGHFPEYFWLKDLTTPFGAVVFLGFTGATTGWFFYKTKNVLGMMLGHWLLNLLLAGTAIIYFGL
jgi:hypothetical protein